MDLPGKIKLALQRFQFQRGARARDDLVVALPHPLGLHREEVAGDDRQRQHLSQEHGFRDHQQPSGRGGDYPGRCGLAIDDGKLADAFAGKDVDVERRIRAVQMHLECAIDRDQHTIVLRAGPQEDLARAAWTQMAVREDRFERGRRRAAEEAEATLVLRRKWGDGLVEGVCFHAAGRRESRA